jgi:DNA-binding MarR family transcriptional regulator
MSEQHYQPDSFAIRDCIGYAIKRAQALLINQIELAVASSGLTSTQWLILMYLRDGIAFNATNLCAQLRHDSGALTRVLDQLEARGLLERERSREDRRTVDLRLTALGLSTVEGLIPQVTHNLNEVLSEFSRTEVNELTRLLAKLTATLDRADAGDKGVTA